MMFEPFKVFSWAGVLGCPQGNKEGETSEILVLVFIKCLKKCAAVLLLRQRSLTPPLFLREEEILQNCQPPGALGLSIVSLQYPLIVYLFTTPQM